MLVLSKEILNIADEVVLRFDLFLKKLLSLEEFIEPLLVFLSLFSPSFLYFLEKITENFLRSLFRSLLNLLRVLFHRLIDFSLLFRSSWVKRLLWFFRSSSCFRRRISVCSLCRISVSVLFEGIFSSGLLW